MSSHLPALRTHRLPGPWRSVRVDSTSTHLTLHTVQHRAVWDELARHGIHRPSRWTATHDFAESYDWMHRQMATALSTTSDGMVWLWAQHPLRGFGLLRPGPDEVLLTCRVPRENVLVSDFGDWHCVLNRSPFVRSLPGEDEEAYGRRLDLVLDHLHERLDTAGAGKDSFAGWPDSVRREVESTWAGIFDREQWTARSVLQATAHELRAEHIVDALQVSGSWSRSTRALEPR